MRGFAKKRYLLLRQKGAHLENEKMRQQSRQEDQNATRHREKPLGFKGTTPSRVGSHIGGGVVNDTVWFLNKGWTSWMPLYCKHWIPRWYNTVQFKTYFSGFEPYRFGPRWGRIAVRSVLKWRHPQRFRALNTALAKSWTNRRHGWPCRRANFSRLLQASTCKCHERKRISAS